MELRHAVWAMGPETCAHTHTHKPVIQTELFSTTGELICCCCSHLLDKVNKLLFLKPPPIGIAIAAGITLSICFITIQDLILAVGRRLKEIIM